MSPADPPRRTLRAAAEVAGFGLFTGRPGSVRILPAAAGTGIQLRRVDLPGSVPFPATVASLAAPPPGMPARNTILAPAGAPPLAGVFTVEHLLSALAAMAITDALVEVTGPEVPIGDGSAQMFVEAITRAGATDLAGTALPIRIRDEIVVESGAGRIVARPRAEAGCSYTYELDYGPGAPIAAQSATFSGGPGAYAAEVAPARTFCLQAEAEQMRAMGLFKHLSPRDMLVLGPDGPIENTLRYPDEPARHKVLDLIGDLALAGRPLQVDVVATRAGHALNHEMAKALIRAAV